MKVIVEINIDSCEKGIRTALSLLVFEVQLLGDGMINAARRGNLKFADTRVGI